MTNHYPRLARERGFQIFEKFQVGLPWSSYHMATLMLPSALVVRAYLVFPPNATPLAKSEELYLESTLGSLSCTEIMLTCGFPI